MGATAMADVVTAFTGRGELRLDDLRERYAKEREEKLALGVRLAESLRDRRIVKATIGEDITAWGVLTLELDNGETFTVSTCSCCGLFFGDGSGE